MSTKTVTLTKSIAFKRSGSDNRVGLVLMGPVLYVVRLITEPTTLLITGRAEGGGSGRGDCRACSGSRCATVITSRLF